MVLTIWSSQREQLELEIASRLSEANSYEEQAAFEELIHGSIAAARPKLEDAIAATEEIYVCSLPWVREQRSGQTIQEGKEPESAPEFDERLPNALEACADRMDQHQRQIVRPRSNAARFPHCESGFGRPQKR